jgi:hypothetical protein
VTKLHEPPARKHRQWFGRLRHIPKSHKSAPPVCQFADVFPGSGFLQVADKFWREIALYRRQNRAPAFRNADHSSARRQRRYQSVQYALHAGNQVFGREQPRRVYSKGGKRQRIFLHRVTLGLRQYHHHRDTQRQLWDGTQQVEHLYISIVELSKQNQHRP